MSIISKLKVWIGSDTSNLERGFKRGKKEASGFGSAMKKLKGTLASVFAVSSIVSLQRMHEPKQSTGRCRKKTGSCY